MAATLMETVHELLILASFAVLAFGVLIIYGCWHRKGE